MKKTLTVEGYVALDAEATTTVKGDWVLKFSIPVWQGANKKPMWINVLVLDSEELTIDGAGFNEDSETLGIDKGTFVTVTGDLIQEFYKGKGYLKLFAKEVTINEAPESTKSTKPTKAIKATKSTKSTKSTKPTKTIKATKSTK